jgi:hypothetical protein
MTSHAMHPGQYKVLPIPLCARPPHPQLSLTLTYTLYCLQADIVYTALFALEMVLKMFAKGLILHPDSYFRTGWDM